ncbi:MAG TPA: efflux RND transporter periplasmic adaptor subunit [Leucothrix sp.]|nr:efflux RND transporter periplasmic adaptor subunit [Leucothrix sp.]
MNNVFKTFLVTVIPLLLISFTNALAKGDLFTVSTQLLSSLLVNDDNSAPANVISLNHSTISAEIMGRALMIEGEVGDQVKKGKRLVTLDCRSYLLAKKQAEAGLQVAKTQLNYSNKQFKRNQNLLKKGIIPRESFEKAEAGKLTALADIHLKKASIETTSLAIDRCQISAPFTGQITQRLVQQGQLVTAGTPLFKIMQNDKLEIKTQLSPAQVKMLDDSPVLEFVVGDKHFKTVVRSIIKTIDITTRTQEVRLSLPKGTKVSAGLSGRIAWQSKEQLLPAEYILRRNNQLGVMLAEDIVEGIGKAKFYPLPEAHEGQAVNTSLPENSAVITINRYRVADGQQIKIQQ